MGFVTYGQTIGVFASNHNVRLDIGTQAMKVDTPASHVTWATKLIIRRVDGPSVGAVEDTHLVGIFSETNGKRLDVGDGSLKKNVPVDHLSWGTKLKIWPATSQGSKAGQRINYGDVVGVFSEDRRYRLDIGSRAVKKEADASHNSWATKLYLQDYDPVVQVTAVNSIKYELSKAKITSTKINEMMKVDLPNSTNYEQTFDLSKTFQYSSTKTYNNDIGFKAGTEVSGKAGVPLVSEGEVKVSAEVSFNHTWGTSETETTTINWKAKPVAKPNTVVRAMVVVSKSKIEVPFTMNCDAKRLSGKWDRTDVSGVFKRELGHDFLYTLEDFDLNMKPIGGPKTATAQEMSTSVQ